MHRLLLTTATLMLLASPVMAEDKSPSSENPATATAPSTDISKAPAGSYELEKNHASITFKVMHMGNAYYTMRFNDFDADLTLDPAKPEASALNVSIKPASLDSNNPKLTEHTAGPDFFDVAKYPTITFKSTRVEKTGANTGKVTGDLTMHGVTKPVTLDVTFNNGSTHPMMKKFALGFSATTTIKRSEFGMGYGIPMVGDDVYADIEVEMLKK